MKEEVRMGFPFHLMLIGFMGTGKTSVARELSKLLNMDEVDTDQLIVMKEGRTIPAIFEESGEDYFRNCESEIIIELQKKNSLIVSCGGGIVLRKENIENMKKSGKIVLLTATADTIFDRVKDGHTRPVLNNNMNVEFINELLEKRKDKYIAAAELIIATDGKEVESIAKEIIEKIINV